jgi:hypothetical protein
MMLYMMRSMEKEVFDVNDDDDDEEEGGEYGRILESTSSSSPSFPNKYGKSKDTILRRRSMGNDAIVVASSAMMTRVPTSREEVAMLSARSTGDKVADDCLRSSETSLRNLIFGIE